MSEKNINEPTDKPAKEEKKDVVEIDSESPEFMEAVKKQMLKLIVIPGSVLAIISGCIGYLSATVGQNAAYADAVTEFSKSYIETANRLYDARLVAETSANQYQVLSNKMSELYKEMETNSSESKNLIGSLRTNSLLKLAEDSVSEMAEAIVKEKDFIEKVSYVSEVRLSNLENTVNSVVKGKDEITLVINNPAMTGPDKASCPDGMYIASIHASKGVGGRNATDGISQITVTCKPIFSEKP